MQDILNLLSKSLENLSTDDKDTLIQELINSNSKHIFKDNYPAALVHDKNETSVSLNIKELLSKSDAIRTIDLVLLKQDVQTLTFTAKRPKDFWKRLSSVGHIKAMISFLCVRSNACSDDFIENSVRESSKGQWPVETQLRDAMRANKENRDLGSKPFIMLMCRPKNEEKEDHIENLLRHYFKENVQVIGSLDNTLTYYLAYHEHMGEIGMRYFYRFEL